jgi:hypothetical protein
MGKWTVRHVLREKMRQEIDKRTAEMSGEAAGTPGYIKCYGKAWSELVAGLSSEKLSEYAALAESWNKQGAGVDIKRRHVH